MILCCFGGDSDLPLGSSCAADSDCAEPFVCQYGRCRSECDLDQDCEESTVCVPSESGGGGVCTLVDEASCTEGSCPGDLVCGRFGMCRALCDEGQCPDDEVCVRPERGESFEPTAPYCVEGGTQHLAISSDEDDGEIFDFGGSQLFVQGEDEDGVLFIGRWSYSARSETWGFFRFELNDSIPEGAIILKAVIKLWGLGPCYIESCGEPISCTTLHEDATEFSIQATDEANPAAVTDPSLVPGVIDTTTAVSWIVDREWADGSEAHSPNIAPIFQELLDTHDGLQAERHVVLWVSGVDYDECAEVRAADYSHSREHGGTSQPATMQIAWQNPR